MNKLKPEPEYGTPDDENPEWTDEDFTWAVRSKDFANHTESLAFLIRRLEIKMTEISTKLNSIDDKLKK